MYLIVTMESVLTLFTNGLFKLLIKMNGFHQAANAAIDTGQLRDLSMCTKTQKHSLDLTTLNIILLLTQLMGW